MIRRLAATACLFGAMAYADTLTTRNGDTIQGTFAGGDTRTVRFLIGNQVRTFHVGEVVNIMFGDNGDQSANDQGPPPPPPAGEAPPPDNSGLQTQRAYEQPNPAAMGVTIPAGTPIVVRTIDTVDSQDDRTGQTFRASVDEPVIINGQEIIPRGADAMVKLVASQQSGKYQGKTVLTLALQQVMVNGRMVDMYTESVSKSSGSRGARTVKTVGGGAALGAIIGGIAGGGAGAAIGAASGGAIGAGAEAITAGQRVKVPAETRLTFTLQSAVQL